MKRRLYTRVPAAAAVGDPDHPFSRTEIARADSYEHDAAFPDASSLVRYRVRGAPHLLGEVQSVLGLALSVGAQRIVSIGAGDAVREYLLAQFLGPDVQVVATDFNETALARARALLGDWIAVAPFDMFHDDVGQALAQVDRSPDLVVFFTSSYVLDDTPFVSLFAALRAAQVPRVVDVHSAIMGPRTVALTPWRELRHRLGKANAPRKFHGYQRTPGHVRRLYRRAGWTVAGETSIPGKTSGRIFTLA